MTSDSRLEKILEKGEFAVTSECGPPRGADPEVIKKKGELIKESVDAINVTDNQTSVVRMSSFSSCVLLKQMGINPVLQMVTRDRNRIAIQSDILGAAALGLNNILCLSGDHQKFGDHPTAKNVYDMDSLQMVQMVTDMRDKAVFQCGDEFKGQTAKFLIGAAAAPFADPIPFRPLRLAKKINAGANFIQTQLIYDIEAFATYMEKVRELGVHEKAYILAGVGPLKSPGMAKYMKNNVPGILVPDEVINRMTEAGKEWVGKKAADLSAEEKKARSKAWQTEGIQVCIDLIKEIQKIEGVAGVHIMAIEWEKAVKPIVEGAGLYPRPEVN